MSDFPRTLELGAASGSEAVFSTTQSLVGVISGGGGSTAWPSANLAIFVPVLIPQRCTIYKIVVAMGGTGGGNFDAGIYDASGNRLVAIGATARVANSEQVLDITDTQIGPGLYYMALAADGTNNYQMWSPSGASPVPLQKARLAGSLEAASSYTLPATATMVARTTAPVPLMALYGRSH